MPKRPTQQQVNEALERWREFESRKNWQRSKIGNLTRIYDGRRVTVFKQKGPRDEHRFYGWCISLTADEYECCDGYWTQRDAMNGLGEALGVSE
jgi:hypothetical protein